MATSGSYATVCPICKDDFRDPVFIQCHHSFCRLCIGEWIRHNASHKEFHCPVCREINIVPESGVAGLKKCFYIQQIRDAGRGAAPVALYPMCESHTQEDMRFYCLKCNTATCRDCKLTKHVNHDFESIDIVAEKMRKKLHHFAYTAREYMNSFTEIKIKLNRIEENVKQQRNSLIDECKRQADILKASIDDLAKNIENEITKTFKPILQKYEQKYKRLHSEQSSMEIFIDSITNLTDIRTNDFAVVSNFGWVSEQKCCLKQPVVESDLETQNYQNMFRVGVKNEKALQDMLGTVLNTQQNQGEQHFTSRQVYDFAQNYISPLPPIANEAGLPPLAEETRRRRCRGPRRN